MLEELKNNLEFYKGLQEGTEKEVVDGISHGMAYMIGIVVGLLEEGKKPEIERIEGIADDNGNLEMLKYHERNGSVLALKVGK